MEKQSFSLKLLSGDFYGQSFIKTVRGPCENLFLYFSEKVQKIAAFAVLFCFSVTKQSFENGFGFPQ